MLAEISVIIPAYNEENGIERTLQSISDQTMPRSGYEIIIVDGGSKDRTRDIASKYADKVLMQKSKAVGGARNDGAEIANGRIIVHTDADVVVPRDWLKNIKSLFGDGVVAVCGPDSPIEESAKYRILYFLINLSNSVAYRFGVVWTRGTNTAVLKEAFLKAGGYTDYPLCDDGELGLRLKRVGKIVYSNKIKVKMSARRFAKHGTLSVLKNWIKGDIMLLMGRRTEGEYHKERY
ncbi:MAG: glycosyltransferase [Candidatus Verstraetearchaeota archaeon]|nr:glycosyltransferase [Candidatus Verstraetearchaeota archaeon]